MHLKVQRSASVVSNLHSCIAALGLVAVAFAASACDDGESLEVDELLVNESLTPVNISPDEPNTGAALDDELMIAEGAVDDEPDLVLEFEGGATLSFFLEDDGSVGMLEAIPAGAGVASVLEDPWLSEATPAMVWYALTKDGEEIPEGLRIHHEALAADGQVAPLEQALAKQVRNLAPVPLADEGSPCLNATFNTNHCNHPDYMDSLCYFNASGGLTWNVSDAYRYKAGFCLQEGTARSWLAYWKGGPGLIDGECVYFRLDHFVWGASSYANGDRYSATTYFTYTWWRPANAFQRAFFHRAIGDAGAVYDFGNRYSWAGCS